MKPAADRIQVFDPLYVKVSIENGEKQPIAVVPRMGTLYGTVQFELKAEGDKEFSFIHVPGHGLVGLSVFQPTWVGPEKRWVAYEVLLSTRDGKQVFPVAGRYLLRAKVVFADERQRQLRLSDQAYSEPVKIEVAERPQAERELIQNAGGVLGAAAEEPRTPAAMEQHWVLHKKLADSIAKQTLEWTGWIVEVTQNKDPSIRQTASLMLHSLRMKADPVTDEVIGIALARHYASLEQWDEVEEVLLTLKEPSQEREELRLRVPKRARIRDAANALTRQPATRPGATTRPVEPR